MEELLKKIDTEKYIGNITLTNGEKLYVPKISMKKIIGIVKFLGVDATKMYGQIQDILQNPELDDITKIATVFDSLSEKQLIHIFSILLDMEDEEALNLDPNEMLDIVILYLDKTNISKTFFQIRQIYKKMFNKDLPDIGEWLQQKAQAAQELQEKREEAMKPMEVELAQDGKKQ